MDWSIYITILSLGIVLLFFYSQNKLKNRIYCSFRRINKTKIEKFVPQNAKYVYFDKSKKNPSGRYNINTKRITLLWYNRGINQFFPMWVPSLDFSWDSPNPLNPENFQTTWDTPEARQASQQEDAFISFAKGVQQQTGTKSRFPDWLFPVVTIGLILVIGYWIYQLSGQIAVLQQQIAIAQGY